MFFSYAQVVYLIYKFPRLYTLNLAFRALFNLSLERRVGVTRMPKRKLFCSQGRTCAMYGGMKLVSREYLFCVRPSRGQNLQINHNLIGREGLGA